MSCPTYKHLNPVVHYAIAALVKSVFSGKHSRVMASGHCSQGLKILVTSTQVVTNQLQGI